MNRRNQFATPEHVRRHIERVLPDEARRVSCLSIFADSIDRLQAHGPDKWGAYCENNHVRLRGGGIIVLTIESNDVWLALDQEAIDSSESARNKLSDAKGMRYDPGRWAHYKRPRTTNVFFSPSAENKEDWLAIRELHFALLDRIAQDAFRVDSQEKHQPALIAYLQVLLRRRLPEPVYSSKLKQAEETTSSAAQNNPTPIVGNKQSTIARLANTARDTVASANGQQALRTVKNKDLRFGTSQEFESYIGTLISSQNGICAITGLPLQFDDNYNDPEMLCSLDRIDSNGHYEPDNLQVVCRFVNRWKNDENDAEFRRLIDVIRSAGSSR